MKTNVYIEKKLKELKPVLSQKYYVDKIGYFGSFSRNEQLKDSDIDILVSFRKPLGWEFFDLQEFLVNELKLKVDLVSEKALKQQLKQVILDTVKYVWIQLRNLITHEYFGIDYEMIWEIAKKNLPQNRKDLQKIIEKEKAQRGNKGYI